MITTPFLFITASPQFLNPTFAGTMSPEIWTAECFWKHLQRRLKKTPTPEGATRLSSIGLVDRLDEKGNPFKTNPHHTEALAGLGFLPEKTTGVPPKPRAIHSAQRHGNIIEILLWPENYNPSLEVQDVTAIRFVYKSSTSSGFAKVDDIGIYPLSYFDKEGPTEDKARCRMSAVLEFENLERESEEDFVYVLLDGKAECN